MIDSCIGCELDWTDLNVQPDQLIAIASQISVRDRGPEKPIFRSLTKWLVLAVLLDATLTLYMLVGRSWLAPWADGHGQFACIRLILSLTIFLGWLSRSVTTHRLINKSLILGIGTILLPAIVAAFFLAASTPTNMDKRVRKLLAAAESSIADGTDVGSNNEQRLGLSMKSGIPVRQLSGRLKLGQLKELARARMILRERAHVLGIASVVSIILSLIISLKSGDPEILRGLGLWCDTCSTEARVNGSIVTCPNCAIQLREGAETGT